MAIKWARFKDYCAEYSEAFEQIRFTSAVSDNFYYWMTPLSRVDTVDCKDETCCWGPWQVVEQGDDRVHVVAAFESTIWQKKEMHCVFTAEGAELYVVVEGKGCLDRLFFGMGLAAGAVIGSTPGYDRYIPGCPNFLGRPDCFVTDFFSIHVANETTHWGMALNGGPLMYGFLKDGVEQCLAAGLVVKPGENQFSGFDFNYKPDETLTEGDHIINTQSFSVAYDGHLKVDGRWETPHLCLRFCDSFDAALEDHCGLLEERGAISSERTETHDWWRRPIFCGWHEQVALGHRKEELDGLSFADMEGNSVNTEECTQENYERFVRVLREQRLGVGTLIVDAKWQQDWAGFVEDKKKWPDMRAFVDACHDVGIKVVLWLQAWGTEGLDAEECIVCDGELIAKDPTTEAYQRRLREGMAYMLGSGPGCLDVDGFKIDYTNRVPVGRDIKTAGGLYGFELQHAYLKLVRESAKAVKADALISVFVANPYYRDVCDMIRLGDYYSAYGRPLDTMWQRARIARVAMAGKLIDTDGSPHFSLAEDAMAELREQAKLGVPTIYQVEWLYQHRGFNRSVCRRLTDGDYELVRDVLDGYLAEESL